MTYLRNAWYVAAWSTDLESGQPMAITILDQNIVIYRGEHGVLVALEDRCVHRMAPLSLGRCEGDNLRCMYHGFLFNPQGAAIEIPGQDIIPPKANVRSFPVVDRHGWIFVWMGDAAAADASLIPDIVGPAHPDYSLGCGYLDYAAEAQLISDNLLDFSHLAYVHAQSFQLGEQMAKIHANITTLPRGIRYGRWIEGSSLTQTGEIDEPLDMYLTYDFLVPGIFLLQSAAFALGTAKRLDFGHADDFSTAIRDVSYSGQAVTPSGDGKARYFFSFGPHRRFDDPVRRKNMMALIDKAFDEDKTMIEAQQKVIAASRDKSVVPTMHDRSITMYNGIVSKLARQEQPA
jgi:phenylpropionate dioxygenase-like ring-hydroxylating dioxygenase large terminal subunit